MKEEYLIVDDEPDLCWALDHLLRSKGLSCQKVQTAQGALEMMKTHRFQLAFLDLTLPDMNGLELARRLRVLDPLLRFVIVSGYLSMEAAAAQAQEQGLILGRIQQTLPARRDTARHRADSGGGVRVHAKGPSDNEAQIKHNRGGAEGMLEGH